jgi:hypothetical protein
MAMMIEVAMVTLVLPQMPKTRQTTVASNMTKKVDAGPEFKATWLQPIEKKDRHPFFISPVATEKRGCQVPPQQHQDHLHQPLTAASTRAHAPQAISNPLTPTRAQLQKPNPPPDHLVSPSTSISQQHLLVSQQHTHARVLIQPN